MREYLSSFGLLLVLLSLAAPAQPLLEKAEQVEALLEQGGRGRLVLDTFTAQRTAEGSIQVNFAARDPATLSVADFLLCFQAHQARLGLAPAVSGRQSFIAWLDEAKEGEVMVFVLKFPSRVLYGAAEARGTSFLLATPSFTVNSLKRFTLERNFKDLEATQVHHDCRIQLGLIEKAAERYAAEHLGLFPEKLEDLTPGYLSELPRCPGDAKTTYHLESGRFPPSLRVFCADKNHDSNKREDLRR